MKLRLPNIKYPAEWLADGTLIIPGVTDKSILTAIRKLPISKQRLIYAALKKDLETTNDQ